MRINTVGRIRSAFVPGHIVHPGFITMRLLCGGGERVAQVIKPKIGREMLMKGAFEKKKGNRQGGADFVDIRQNGGVQGYSAGFEVLPFFLFGGLNGNEAAFVEIERVHLTRPHTGINQKPKAKLRAGLRLFCKKRADKFARNDFPGGAFMRELLYLRHNVGGQKSIRNGRGGNPIQNAFCVLSGAEFFCVGEFVQKLLAVGGGEIAQGLIPEKAEEMPPDNAAKVVVVFFGNVRPLESVEILQGVIPDGKRKGRGQNLRRNE